MVVTTAVISGHAITADQRIGRLTWVLLLLLLTAGDGSGSGRHFHFGLT